MHKINIDTHFKAVHLESYVFIFDNLNEKQLRKIFTQQEPYHDKKTSVNVSMVVKSANTTQYIIHRI